MNSSSCSHRWNQEIASLGKRYRLMPPHPYKLTQRRHGHEDEARGNLFVETPRVTESSLVREEEGGDDDSPGVVLSR